MLSRREAMAGLAAALTPVVSWVAAAEAAAEAPPRISQTIELEAKPALFQLRPDQPPIPIWELQGPAAPPRLKRGQVLQVRFRNALPVAAVLDWRGLDGASAGEALTTVPAVLPAAEATYAILLRHAGTAFCDLWPLAEGEVRPSRPFPLVIEENEPPAVDRDETFLIENWRLASHGSASGTETGDAGRIYSLNGQVLPEISLRCGERLRLRFINGCQREVVALKIEGNEVQVIAMDGAPAEPFPARNNAVVMAPGGRVDAIIDVKDAPGAISPILLHDGKEAHRLARLVTSNEPAPVRPHPRPAAILPADGRPGRLDLRGAVRLNLALDGKAWRAPVNFSVSAPPAFKAKAGRTVVLALDNRAGSATTFHLHGHHFRLLDRLDDGWKPFWLDTLTVEPGQTQRIAFLAEFSGRWLLESVATDSAAPRLVRWYSVE